LDGRVLATFGALAALGLTLADWWTVSWDEGMTGAGRVGITGGAGTGGSAALVPAVVLVAALTTLTLARTGRRVMAVVALAAGLGMAVLGFAGPAPSDGVVEQEAAMAALGGGWTLERTVVPMAYGVLGVLVTAAAVLWFLRPPERRSRHLPATSGNVTDPVASWKAMDAGLDPTDEEESR
jgi:hypothetical protein